jgi:hypothetical protein
MLKAKVSKLNINIFTKMEHVLTQFTINIEELTLFPFNNINTLQLQYNTLNNNINNNNNIKHIYIYINVSPISYNTYSKVYVAIT